MKVGDRVERIKSSHMGMEVGDTDIITRIFGNPFADDGTTVTLKKFKGGGHDSDNLKVISSNIWRGHAKV